MIVPLSVMVPLRSRVELLTTVRSLPVVSVMLVSDEVVPATVSMMPVPAVVKFPPVIEALSSVTVEPVAASIRPPALLKPVPMSSNVPPLVASIVPVLVRPVVLIGWTMSAVATLASIRP